MYSELKKQHTNRKEKKTMKKVAENTFRAYAVEAVKKLNTLEIKATLNLSSLRAEIDLYRENVKVGHVAIINGNDMPYAKDYTREEIFTIIADHKNMKSLFEKLYEVVNSLLDNGWFAVEAVEKEEVAEETTEQPKEDSKVEAVASNPDAEIATLTITLSPENEEDEPKIVTYGDVSSFYVVDDPQKVAEIEGHTDGSSIDPHHKYLNIVFNDGTCSTYRYSVVDQIQAKYKKSEPKEEEQQITVVENPKLFIKDLAQSLNTAGFATTYKEVTKGTYAIHAMADKGVMVDIDFEAGVSDKQSTSAVVYDLADCSVIDGGKYNTEADYIKEIVEKVISSSNREQKIVEANKFFESTDTTDDKVRKLRKEFRRWEVLQEREKEADEAYEANYTDKELEKAADEAYAAEYKQYDKIARMIAELINVDVLTAKGMLMKDPKHVKKILEL